jgi:hypothetical protein
MGLMVNVYRTSRNGKVVDCTLDGFSSYSDSICLVNVRGPSEPDAFCAIGMLVPGYVVGTAFVVAAHRTEDGYVQSDSRSSDGGNFAACSDSRFSEAVEAITGHPFYGAIPIHDRVE